MSRQRDLVSDLVHAFPEQQALKELLEQQKSPAEVTVMLIFGLALASLGIVYAGLTTQIISRHFYYLTDVAARTIEPTEWHRQHPPNKGEVVGEKHA